MALDSKMSVTTHGLTKLIPCSEGLSTPTTPEFGLSKILELSWKLQQQGEKVRVWVGFNTSTFIGPFFFEEMRDSGFLTAIVTGERYADILQNRIIPSLTDKHLLEDTIFMQDDALPHIARRVKDLLRTLFGC